MTGRDQTISGDCRRSTIPAAITLVILAAIFAALMVSSRWRGEAETMRRIQADLAAHTNCADADGGSCGAPLVAQPEMP